MCTHAFLHAGYGLREGGYFYGTGYSSATISIMSCEGSERKITECSESSMMKRCEDMAVLCNSASESTKYN